MKVQRIRACILAVIILLIFTACGTELPDSGSSSLLESSSSSSDIQQSETSSQPSSSQTETTEPSSSSSSSASSQTGQAESSSGAAAAPSSSQEKEDGKTTFTLSVSCKTALASDALKDSVRKVLPSDGFFLKAEEIEFTPGENAFDVVLRECRRRRIAVASTGSYVQSIGGLTEKDCGDLSGWMCRVNGVFLDRSLKEYILQDGDRVEWLYTCNLGKDL